MDITREPLPMEKILVLLVSVTTFFVAPSVSFAGLNSLGGLNTTAQTFATSTAPNSPHLLIQSSGTVHTFKWNGTPWLLNQGGTGATTFAAGSIPFIFGGILSENNANLFWDNIKHALGIGNSSPQHALDVSGAFYSRLVTLNPSATVTVDWNTGNVQTLTLSSNSTLVFSNGQPGGEYKLILNQDATGGKTVIWPVSVKWPSGTAPLLTTTANGTDMINFINTGSDYLGSFTLNYLASVPPTPLSNDMVAYWKLDENSDNANDSIHSFTLNNVGSSPYVSGLINNSLSTNGTSQYLAASVTGQAVQLYNTNLTINLWVNFSATSNFGVGIYGSSGSTRDYLFYGGVPANGLRLALEPSDDVPVSWSPSSNTWYMITVTYNASNGNVKYYVNGSQQGTTQTTFGGRPIGNTGDFSIAGWNSVSTLNGQTDEVGIWNRELSSSEISRLYNSGSGISYPF